MKARVAWCRRPVPSGTVARDEHARGVVVGSSLSLAELLLALLETAPARARRPRSLAERPGYGFIR